MPMSENKQCSCHYK